MRVNEENSSGSKNHYEGSVVLVALLIISIFALGAVAMFSIGMKHGFQSINKGAWPFFFAAFIFIAASVVRINRRQL